MPRIKVWFTVAALYMAFLATAYAANNPAITVTANAGITGPSIFSVGSSASYTATLSWPTGVTNPGGQCTWSFDTAGLVTIDTTPNPGPVSTANTFTVTITGVAPGKGKLKASWATTSTGYTSPAVGEFDVTVVKLEITPEDNFANRSKTRLGLGEVATLKVLPSMPFTWSIKPPTDKKGTISDVNGAAGTATYTAPEAAIAGVTLVATSGSQSFEYSLDIVAPDNAYQVKLSEGKVAGTCGAWMKAATYLLPRDVSFYKIQVGEGTCNGVGAGSQAPSNGQVHPAWGPSPVSKGDATTGCLVKGPNLGTPEYDYIMTQQPLNVGAGTFEWNIPWEYSIGSVNRKEFARLLHKEVFDGNKKLTLSKSNGTATISIEQTGP